jgi:hypothetical protein
MRVFRKTLQVLASDEAQTAVALARALRSSTRFPGGAASAT